MVKVCFSQEVKNDFPNLKIGILEVKDIVNKKYNSALEEEKRKLEDYIRKHCGEIENNEIIKSYNSFFRKYGKTYPIQFQIQSILKNKNLPSVSTVVEAMFMAELKNLFLTAGHDLDLLKGNLQTKLANGKENYQKINGENQELKSGDIFTADDFGVISSVLSGPDYRTRINETSKNLLFFSYFLFKIDDRLIEGHLRDILNNINISADRPLEFPIAGRMPDISSGLPHAIIKVFSAAD